MRTSGILMPVFSLPSKYGIGCFSKEAYQFVDFLKESGQKKMAGTAPWTDKLWGFPVSVFFIFCRKSVFHRSGAACGAAASDESGV